MALGNPVPNGRVTQRFGHAVSSVAYLEPAMWFTGNTKAYWLKYPGSSYDAHYHPGIDISAISGTLILAMEAGKVVFSGWKNSVSGYAIEVEIRPGVRYGFNHCNGRPTALGTKVIRGQAIATIGQTGVATGPHTHYYVSIQEKGADGILRTFIYNPALFQVGGALANDSRVKPLGSTTPPSSGTWKGRVTTTAPKPAGVPDTTCNIRNAANLSDSSIWARTFGDGFTYQFINGVKGKKLWANTSAYAWNGGYVGDFAQVKTGGGTILYIHKTILKIGVQP